MVQRNNPEKLSIQAETRFTAPSSSQHPDIRNKGGGGGGPELKKKMKKSGSFKRSDLESLKSYPATRAKLQFNKPPSNVSVAAVTPQKIPPVKVSDGSPNYMKSTRSSNARKEHSQVSSSSFRTRCNSKSQPSRDSNYQKLSVSGHNPVRNLTKTSSLKPVRTLTKTSSMKSGRISNKNNSGIAPYPNQNVCRSTCSSTLKDSKFPAYLMLHPKGTESEGTSIMKVCPYTYCSLNGHHHDPLPPLKCFLSARRSLLRAQKSMRLKGLSPVNAKPSGKRREDVDTGQKIFNRDPGILKADSAGLRISPLIEEVGLDFFVEIYAQPREDTNESTGRSNNDENEAEIDFAINPQVPKEMSYSVKDDAETEQGVGGRAADSLSDESSHSEISLEDNPDQISDFILAEMDISMAFPEQIQQEVEDTDHPPCFIQEETDLNSESECHAESELDEFISEATNMDWEEGEIIAPHFDNGADCSTFVNGESDPISVVFQGSAAPGLHDELVFIPDDIVTNFCEEVSANGELLTGENRGSFDEQFSEGDFEPDGGDQTSEASLDQLFSIEDAFEEPKATNEETDGDHAQADFIHNGVSSASAAYPLEESISTSGENYGVPEPSNFLQEHNLLGDDKPRCSDDDENGTLMNEKERKSLEDESEVDQGSAKLGCQINELEDEGFQHKTQTSESVDSEINQSVASRDHELDQVPPSANVGDRAEEKEQVEDVNELLGIQISGSCQVFSETNQDKGNEDQHAGKDPSISSSIYFEEHSNYEWNRLKSSEEGDERDEKMQMEDKAEIDAAETCSTANDFTCAEEESTIINEGSGSDQQLPENCTNLEKPIRCKRLIKDWEEPRKFNPREPQYLPVEPDPEAEKVDLRHQMMDERKNAEEWMIDYAIQQATTKLAPARKRRVALLVEAFEMVLPLPTCESHLQHNTTAFSNTRPIQACS